MSARRRTLRSAVSSARREGDLRRTLCALDGCPVGGWAETTQALGRITDELPRREERAYSVHDLVAKFLTVDGDRYRWRGEEVES